MVFVDLVSALEVVGLASILLRLDSLLPISLLLRLGGSMLHV